MIINTKVIAGVVIALGIVAFAGTTSLEHEETATEEPATYCKIRERVEVPVGDERLLQELLDCRKDLARASEENNCCINCMEQECE